MEKHIISKFQNEFIFFKKTFIRFIMWKLNVDWDIQLHAYCWDHGSVVLR